MITKNQLSFVRSLKQKKYRSEHGMFIAEGSKIIFDLISSNTLEVHVIYVLSEVYDLFCSKISKKIDLIKVSSKEMEQISGLSSPSDALAIFKIPVNTDTPTHDGLILCLEEIQDPGNLGTIIRTADWFGINQIVCSPTCADIYNLKTVQATMGSLGRVKIFTLDLETFLEKDRNVVYGTLLHGSNIYETPTLASGVIVFGNEGKGISEQLKRWITHPITIPKFGGAESLNVATAVGIVCSEFKRRK